jgi:hypothetical protein
MSSSADPLGAASGYDPITGYTAFNAAASADPLGAASGYDPITGYAGSAPSTYDPTILSTVGTPDETNTGLLQVLQTAIATAGSLTALAISGPKKIQPGAGAANPARPSILAPGTAGSIQTILILGAVVLLGIAAFKAFSKKGH